MDFEVMDHIEKADVDSKGYLTRDELRNYFQSLGQNPDFIDEWFKWFDLDNKGVIEAEEVCTTLGMTMRKPYAERVKANREKAAAGQSVAVSQAGHEKTLDAQDTKSQNDSRSTSTRSLDGDGVDMMSNRMNSSLSSTINITSDDEIPTYSASKSGLDRTISADITIEEMPTHFEESAPTQQPNEQKVLRRNESLENLRKSFEILHEEKVNEELLNDIMRIVKNNERKVQEEREMAKLLKDGVEEKHGRHWQAIVAYTNLGCNVEHEVNTFVYLRKNNHIYILFRTPISD
nr:Calcium binding protein [Hymenolepis microstoma]